MIKMNMVMNSTTVRNHFSEFVDNVVRDKPQFMKRNRDLISFFSEEQLNSLLEKYQFHVKVEKDEDGSFNVMDEKFDLIGWGDTPEEALNDFAEQLIEYAQEYYEDFAMYFQSPNRRPHYPYILHVLSKNSVNEVRTIIHV